MNPTDFPHVFVVTTRKAPEQRAASLAAQLRRAGIQAEPMLRGDMADLTPEVLDRTFAGPMHRVWPATSCAYKHLLICRQVVERGLECALVLEDDVELKPDFRRLFPQSVSELRSYGMPSAIVSYEDSRLRFVPRSRRRKGRLLYPEQKDRFAACYLITRAGARALLDYVDAHKCDLPIDWVHLTLIREGLITYYWCEPAIASQSSINGKLASTLVDDRAWVRRLKWLFKYNYRRLLYFFR